MLYTHPPMSDHHNDTTGHSFTDQPGLALNLCKRLNDAWETVTAGFQLQDSRPWQPIRSNTGTVFVGLTSSPRDLEITATILEVIERNLDLVQAEHQQIPGQQQLDI